MARQPASLGTRIRRARERKRLKRPDVAAALGVSLKTIDNWENDRALPRDSLGALGELLGEDFYKPEDAERAPPVPPAIAESVRLAEGLTDEDRARVLEAIAATLRGDPPPTGPGAADPSPGERRAG